MIKSLCYAVVGGDLRSAHVANLLARDGNPVIGMFFDQEVCLDANVKKTNDLSVLHSCDVVIFPLPITADTLTLNAPFGNETVGLESCLAAVNAKSLVLAGRVTGVVEALAKQYGLTMVDYFEREELAVLNAVPTAEGAVAIAMQEKPTTIFASKCLITGYGRISKVLQKILTAMGAEVIVAVRKYSDMAWVRINGAKPIHISQLAQQVHDVDTIFNTVPEMLLDKNVLAHVNDSCLVVDLASKPGGVDFSVAKNLGISTVWALSLPGKVAPITAGSIIRDTISNIISERGIG